MEREYTSCSATRLCDIAEKVNEDRFVEKNLDIIDSMNRAASDGKFFIELHIGDTSASFLAWLAHKGFHFREWDGKYWRPCDAYQVGTFGREFRICWSEQ